jgi:hypothetical protein
MVFELLLLLSGVLWFYTKRRLELLREKIKIIIVGREIPRELFFNVW